MRLLWFPLLLWSLQVVASSTPSSCIRRWQWQVINRCPTSDAQLSSAPIFLQTEAGCVTLCTFRQPMCKAAHFNRTRCSLATNWNELSLWSSSGGDLCKSWVLSLDVFQLLLFMDFRESFQNVLGSANVTVEPFNVSRDGRGARFGGNRTSYIKVTIPVGLSSLTDRRGERAVSFFVYIRRQYKVKSVFIKIGSESSGDTCNMYEDGGKIVFQYNPIKRLYTSTSLTVMQSDADPEGFGLGVGASNITGSYAFLNNKEFSLVASNANPVALDTMIRLGLSTSSDDGCLNGTMVCLAVAPTKLSVDQFSRLNILCQ